MYSINKYRKWPDAGAIKASSRLAGGMSSCPLALNGDNDLLFHLKHYTRCLD